MHQGTLPFVYWSISGIEGNAPFYVRKIMREEAERSEDRGGKVPQGVAETPQKDFSDEIRHTCRSLYI